MSDQSTNSSNQPPAHLSRRTPALAAGMGLLVMAVLAPIAQFGVLKALIVPTDASATINNIAASPGALWGAIAAFLFVAVLDVVVARGLFLLLRPANERLALVIGWLRVVYAVGFALALVSLFEVAQIVTNASATALQSGQVTAGVASSVAAFGRTWDVALVIFSLHLFGLGVLLVKFGAPRLLAALVVVAGAGYLADSLGRLLVPGYSMTFSMFTFVGEALLIVWLVWIAIKGVRPSPRPILRATAALAAEPVA